MAATPPCDALVLFGATGDLAKKKIFPAVYQMTLEDREHVPLVGFASSDWDDALGARTVPVDPLVSSASAGS